MTSQNARPSGPRVLIAADDAGELEELAGFSLASGLSVEKATNATEALVAMLNDPPQLTVLGENLQPLPPQCVVMLTRLFTDAPILVIGNRDDVDEVELLESGADVYLRQPISRAMFIARASNLINRYAELREQRLSVSVLRNQPQEEALARLRSIYRAISSPPVVTPSFLRRWYRRLRARLRRNAVERRLRSMR